MDRISRTTQDWIPCATTPRRADAATFDNVRRMMNAEVPAHAEMRRIIARHRAGIDTTEDRRRYRTMWLAIALRRSVCRRAPLSSDLFMVLARWKQALDAAQHERARAAVEDAFGPDDAPMEGAGSLPL